MNRFDRKSKNLLFIEIIGDLIIASIKFAVGIFGNSAALIAEGFHSLSDTTNQFFLLIGIHTSKKPADSDHPFGYGKERFFWAFLSAFFIFAVSGGVAVWKGVAKINNPTPVANFGLCFLVLGIALIFQFFILYFSSRTFKTFVGKTKTLGEMIRKLKLIKEPTVINLWLGDWVAVVGNFLVIIALYLVYITGNAIYDGIASIIIGVMLITLGLFLIRDTKNLLIGEAVTPAMYEEIAQIIRSQSGVRGIVKLKTMHLTPTEILINADVDFEPGLETTEIDATVDKIENAIKIQIPAAKQISIEVEVRK